MLSEKGQRETYKYSRCDIFIRERKKGIKNKLIDMDNRIVIASSKESWGVGKMSIRDQNVQTCSYKIIYEDAVHNMVTIHITCFKIAGRVKVLMTREKKVF